MFSNQTIIDIVSNIIPLDTHNKCNIFELKYNMNIFNSIDSIATKKQKNNRLFD